MSDDLDFLKRQAQAVLENKAWMTVKASLAQRYQQEWLYAKDTATREMLWAKTRALADIVVEFEVILNSGPLVLDEPPTPPEAGA